MVEMDTKAKQEEKLPKELVITEIEESKNNEDSGVTKTKSKKWIVITISLFAILILGLTFSMIFALINKGSNKILSGITIANIDVSDLTQEKAREILDELNKKSEEKEIVFKHNEIETPITYKALEVEFEISKAIEEAYNVGRQGNIFQNNFEILRTWINKKNINLDFKIDEDVIKQVSENINNSSEDSVVEASYYVEGDKLIITSGKVGIQVKQDELKQSVYGLIKIDAENSIMLDVPVSSANPAEIDLEKIRTEIYKKVQDAYYTNNPFTIYPEVKGVDFDIENAKAIIAEKKDEYEIPLIITNPSVTIQQIGTEAFPDLLATFSTNYNAGDTNRTTNLRLAAEKINGTVLLKGDEFSYNKIVGERTIAAGYKMAATFSNGKVVDGLGGGICQISSTLYDAVVMANLKVTTRRNHQFVTSYLSGGKDATVVWGSQDFKFVNSRSYPIRITATVSGGVATVQVWGVKEEVEYDITIETKKTATIAYTTQYVNDSTLPKGKQLVSQNGSNGSKYEAYKVMRLNGEVVSRTLLSKDTYNAKQKIVRVGTK